MPGSGLSGDRPSGMPHIGLEPEGPYPYGPGMYSCIRLYLDGCSDVKGRPPFRPVRRQALRNTVHPARTGGPVSLRAGYVFMHQIRSRWFIVLLGTYDAPYAAIDE